LLPLLLKNPKLLIIIVVAGAAFYFLGGQKACNLGGLSNAAESFSLGGILDEKVYDKAEVFEPLADNVTNPLPERVSLEKYCPDRLNQGQQGSCVAWGQRLCCTKHYAGAGDRPGSQFHCLQPVVFIQPDRIGRLPGILYHPCHGNDENNRGCFAGSVSV
jgi:hypothetical protein